MKRGSSNLQSFKKSVGYTPKILSIVPMRGGSKGIPKKNIKIINGKPLCYYAISASLNCELIDETWISTDDDEIEKVCKSLDPKIKIHRRDPSTGTDSASSSSVILDFINSHNNADIMVLIQVTNPFTKAKDLTNAINKYLSHDYDLLIGTVDNHSFIWRHKIPNSKYIQLLNNKVRMRQKAPIEYQEDGSYYIFSKEKFIKNYNMIPFTKVRQNTNTNNFHIEIDDPIGFEIVENLNKFLL